MIPAGRSTRSGFLLMVLCNPSVRDQNRNVTYISSTPQVTHSQGLAQGGSMTILNLSSALREKQLKLATGYCCESCGSVVPHSMLELHPIPSDTETKSFTGASDILVLCTLCHTRLHDAVIPHELQRSAIRIRPPDVMDNINVILSRPFT